MSFMNMAALSLTLGGSPFIEMRPWQIEKATPPPNAKKARARAKTRGARAQNKARRKK